MQRENELLHLSLKEAGFELAGLGDVSWIDLDPGVRPQRIDELGFLVFAGGAFESALENEAGLLRVRLPAEAEIVDDRGWSGGVRAWIREANGYDAEEEAQNKESIKCHRIDSHPDEGGVLVRS
jgi:hypothetical protein